MDRPNTPAQALTGAAFLFVGWFILAHFGLKGLLILLAALTAIAAARALAR